MKKLAFTVEISASRAKVWDALWLPENYKKWTAVFQEGSFYESDLRNGGEILFLNAERNGMYGRVEENIPFEKMYFRHLGEVKNGEKLPESYGEEATERYDLVEKANETVLTATINAPEEYIPYFAGVFPKALEKVKQLAEERQ